MRASTSLRKPLGVRATADQHHLLTEAAKREHRSVASFVLNAALKEAAQGEARPSKTPQEILQLVHDAQALMKPYRESGRSLVDELIAERRAEAARE